MADAYSAITTSRAYRPQLPHDHAIAELARHSGTQFDPAVGASFQRTVARDTASQTV